MKLKRLPLLLALSIGLINSCDEQIATEVFIVAEPQSQELGVDGTATFVFQLYSNVSFLIPEGTITFSANGGSVSPISAKTDKEGKLTVVFTADDPDNFKGGTVTGSAIIVDIRGEELVAPCSCTAEILPPGESRSPIEIAKKLPDNTYVVMKKGDEPKSYNLSQEESRWYLGRSYADPTKQAQT